MNLFYLYIYYIYLYISFYLFLCISIFMPGPVQSRGQLNGRRMYGDAAAEIATSHSKWSMTHSTFDPWPMIWPIAISETSFEFVYRGSCWRVFRTGVRLVKQISRLRHFCNSPWEVLRLFLRSISQNSTSNLSSPCNATNNHKYIHLKNFLTMPI